MITPKNKTFAYLVGNVVTWLFTSETLPEYNEDQIVAVECPPGTKVGDVYADGKFTTPVDPDLLDSVKATKRTSLTLACGEAILAGFELGLLHYPFSEQDQLNLMAEVIDSLLPPTDDPNWSASFWCATNFGSSDAVWTFKSHSRAEIWTVDRAGKAHKANMRAKLQSLTASLVLMIKVDEVQAVQW